MNGFLRPTRKYVHHIDFVFSAIVLYSLSYCLQLFQCLKSLHRQWKGNKRDKVILNDHKALNMLLLCLLSISYIE